MDMYGSIFLGQTDFQCGVPHGTVLFLCSGDVEWKDGRLALTCPAAPSGTQVENLLCVCCKIRGDEEHPGPSREDGCLATCPRFPLGGPTEMSVE